MPDAESIASTMTPAEEELAQAVHTAIQDTLQREALRAAQTEVRELRLGLGRLLAASRLREELVRLVAAWRGWTAHARAQWV